MRYFNNSDIERLAAEIEAEVGKERLAKEAALTLDISKGDILLGGRFKNVKTKVKEIGTDDKGQPTINGKKLLSFRIAKLMPGYKEKQKQKDKQTEKDNNKPKGKKMEFKKMSASDLMRKSAGDPFAELDKEVAAINTPEAKDKAKKDKVRQDAVVNAYTTPAKEVSAKTTTEVAPLSTASAGARNERRKARKDNSANLSASDFMRKRANPGRGLGEPLDGVCREDGGELQHKGQKGEKEREGRGISATELMSGIGQGQGQGRGLGEPLDGKCREDGGPLEYKGQKGEKEREGRGIRVESFLLEPRSEEVRGIADELREILGDNDLEDLIAEIEGRPEEVPVQGETIDMKKTSAADLVRKSAKYEDLKEQLAGRGLDLDNLLISQSVGDAALNMDADSGNMEDYLMSNPEHLDTIQDNLGSEDLEGIEAFGKLMRDADPELYQ